MERLKRVKKGFKRANLSPFHVLESSFVSLLYNIVARIKTVNKILCGRSNVIVSNI